MQGVDDEHGEAPREDEHGKAPREDEHGKAPREDEHGKPCREDEHGKAPRARRWKSGTVARREVHRLSRTSALLLPRSSFARVAKEISAKHDYKVKWTKDALKALQDGAESYITHNFMRADMARNYTGKRTLSVKDLQYSHYVDELQACQEP